LPLLLLLLLLSLPHLLLPSKHANGSILPHCWQNRNSSSPADSCHGECLLLLLIVCVPSPPLSAFPCHFGPPFWWLLLLLSYACYLYGCVYAAAAASPSLSFEARQRLDLAALLAEPAQLFANTLAL
jgi:hypothetical protein